LTRLTFEIVRCKVYHFYLDGLNTDVDNHVTVERRTTTMGKGRALQIRDVHSAWTSLLGVNCQIRREVSISFWKLNTIKLRPWTAGSLNSVLFAPKIDCLCDLPSVLLQISFRGKTITRLGFVERGGVYAKFRWCVCKGGWCPVVTIRKVLYFPNLSFRS